MVFMRFLANYFTNANQTVKWPSCIETTKTQTYTQICYKFNYSVVPDFGSGKSRIRPFFGNPAKSGSGQISSRIWWMPVQLQYIQLIMDKKITQLTCQVAYFALIVIVAPTKKVQNPSLLHRFRQKNWQTKTVM